MPKVVEREQKIVLAVVIQTNKLVKKAGLDPAVIILVYKFEIVGINP